VAGGLRSCGVGNTSDCWRSAEARSAAAIARCLLEDCRNRGLCGKISSAFPFLSRNLFLIAWPSGESIEGLSAGEM